MQTKTHATRPTAAKQARKPLQPVSGSVRVIRPVGAVNPTTGEIAINGKAYYVTRHETGYRLISWDGSAPTCYDLPLSLESCDCPDGNFRSERPGGCKHRKGLAALRAAGKVA